MITCYIRYKLNLDQLSAFEEYGKIWIKIINQLGGTHHGYFFPSNDPDVDKYSTFSFKGMGSEGPKDIGVAIFSFADWKAYERYRAEAKHHPDCEKANKIVAETKCFTSYERNFMDSVFSDNL